MTVLTVVIPAYNAASTLDTALASLSAQSDRRWCCVVVDDGSTDGTAELALECGDPRVRIVRQANAGVSGARNRGLAEAEDGFVLFLDADDALHPAALERLRAAFARDPETVAAFGTVVRVRPDGRPQPGQKPLHRHIYPSGDVLEAMVRSGFLNVGQMLIRTDAARAVGGFRADLRLSEDWEFAIRLAAHGPFRFIGPVPQVLDHRLSPGGASRSLAADWANHEPFLAALRSNTGLAARLGASRWRALVRAAEASVAWEVGRVNFCERRFAAARHHMLRGLWGGPTPKRLALFALAEASRIINRPLASRLRFVDLDAPPA
jgi:glycosyltransferase involved in cell wall biosynthesis